jgi:hypothetical protein
MGVVLGRGLAGETYSKIEQGGGLAAVYGETDPVLS